MFILCPVFILAQTGAADRWQRMCPPKSLPEIFQKKDSSYIMKPTKNNFFLIIPVVGAQPATGLFVGGITQYTFKGKGEIDKYSVANLGIIYTLKKQWMVNLKNNILLMDNRLFLSGDARFYIFSQSNYGLGTDIIPSLGKQTVDFSVESITEPMDYNYYKFHQTASYELQSNFYVGGGLNLDYYTNIIDKNLDVENGGFTYHYKYNQLHGFSSTEYFLSGLSLNLVYDSRDNQVNTYKGWFANINYRINPVLFEGQQFSNVLFAEYRKFIPLSPRNERYILGIWAYSQLVTNGKVPYLNLPAIGWDQRSRSGEGYTQGFFRGNSLLYTSAELRFPITCNQMLSGTLFANFVTVGNSDEKLRLFEAIQPAIGMGLRLLIDKRTRTNLVFDYAWGNKSNGLYVNAGETF